MDDSPPVCGPVADPVRGDPLETDTYIALLRAAMGSRDVPPDDTARLVLADFLDESGDPDEGETLRQPGYWVVGGGVLAWQHEHLAARRELGPWSARFGPAPTCAVCRRLFPVSLRPDPFDEEVRGETRYEWQCDFCYRERVEETRT